MTAPLDRPPRKDPQVRTRIPTSVPWSRSRRAFEFSAAAAAGRLELQQCNDCMQVFYPPREVCPHCLSMDVDWNRVDGGGRLLAETTIRTSTNAYFRERAPWRVGTVELDCGVTLLAHLHGDVEELQRVRLIARTDRSGQGVLMAMPEKPDAHAGDDRQLRELTCDPRHRRVLVTDARTDLGQSVVEALARSDATIVFAGVAEAWRPFKGSNRLASIGVVEQVPLDVTDTISVSELAGEIGGKVDILINTAEYVRPGGILNRSGVTTAADEMAVNYFGLLRLMQAFAPAMGARGADGVNSACAWVNIFSAQVLSNTPEFACTHASQAAAHALSQSLRSELAGTGVKVVNVFAGPLDDSWRQPLPPPKVTSAALAAAIVNALQHGLEQVTVGAVAEDLMQRFQASPAALERELMQPGSES